MKKFLIVLALIMACSPVFAKTITVEALENFSTEKPSETLDVKLLDDIELDENLTLKTGYVLHGKITDVTDPKRLKRDASFSFVPVTYKDEKGVVTKIKGDYTARYTTKLNKGELAKTAALGVGNYFIKGLSVGYSAIEGAVKNEQDNRLKSSVTEIYENSPLSYVEKGESIEIKKEQTFYLNFKSNEKEEENLPNYEYVELDKNGDSSAVR